MFSIPKVTNVEIVIYNSRGHVVNSIIDNKKMGAGEHIVNWNGRNSNGNLVSSGIYFYRLKTPDFVKIGKAVLIK